MTPRCVLQYLYSFCLFVCLKLLSYCLSICLWWTSYRLHGSFYSRRILIETETDPECRFSVTGLSPLSVCLSVLGVKHQLTYLLKYLITVCLPVYLSACLSACLSVHFQQRSRSCCFNCTWQSLLSVSLTESTPFKTRERRLQSGKRLTSRQWTQQQTWLPATITLPRGMPEMPAEMMMMMSWCLMSSDVSWHIRDKLWPMKKHGSINLYVHGNQKAR